jgi:AcrR family transcriptional regulator
MNQRVDDTPNPAREARREELAHARREIARRAVIAGGAELFASRGFDGTSIADISKLSGVSLTALYDAFSSKEELFLAVIEHVFNRHMLPALQKEEPDVDPGERVLIVIDDVLAAMEADRNYVMLTARGVAGIPLGMRDNGKDPFEPYIAMFVDRLRSLIADAQVAGRARGVSQHTLARALVATVAELARHLVATSPEQPITELSSEIRALFSPVLLASDVTRPMRIDSVLPVES